MSAGPDPQVDLQQIEQARRQINRLAEEIAQLSETELTPPEYYGEFLQRVMAAIQAPAGAVWVRTPQGNLQLQYQINMRQVGLEGEEKRATHGELLRQAALKGQPTLVMPHSSVGEGEGTGPAPGNPTDFVILLAPILYDKQVAGVVEIWQDPRRHAEAQRGFLQFIIRMAGLAAGYTRNHQLRQMVGQQQVWVQLEAFAKQIHGSLNPTEVAYLIANEARRLVEADRVSVAVREGGKPQVRAISGADVVEKRSNLVQLMRALFEKVMRWGEKLVYTGTKDDALPPAVLKALDAYLAESNSKLLILVPLRDDREGESKRPPRSALMMECFEPNVAVEQMAAKLEVVGRHATAALYNSVEYHRIPMRFVWLPLAKVQEGLGGKAKAIWTIILVGLGALIAAMILVPYPLKMDANGTLLPIERRWVFAPVAGTVRDIPAGLKSGSVVTTETELLRMFDTELEKEIRQLQHEIDIADGIVKAHNPQGKEAEGGDQKNIIEAKATLSFKSQQLRELKARTNSTEVPGEFVVKSPINGIILTADFREMLLGRPVKPNEPLLRVGRANAKNPKLSEWEIELKIPQKHIGHVLDALKKNPKGELDVDLLLKTLPTSVFKGKLTKAKIAQLANPNNQDQANPEAVVMAWVRISGKDIPPDLNVPLNRLFAGTEVHTRIRCGNRAMGYALFYGVWEFIYENIVFMF
ncbi:MAG: hypothetical protein L0215_23015 [Gemmataceae bacterium]|nr:hypothetical protein [Gemmataceae bacterium]